MLQSIQKSSEDVFFSLKNCTEIHRISAKKIVQTSFFLICREKFKFYDSNHDTCEKKFISPPKVR